MKTVDINRLKGNYAEHLVSLWLSEQCLVRTVSAGTDIGVDLYCEAVIENQPFLHFMVQVKAIGKDKISSNGGVKEGKFPFKNSDLVYWSKQPIPVYAFLVPVEKWPPEEPKIIYSIRLTEELIKNKKLRKKMSDKCIYEIREGKFSIQERDRKMKRIYEEAFK